MINYLITDPEYYTNDKEIFEKVLKNILNKHHIDIACFRDKKSLNIEELAQIFVKICKENNINKIVINGDISLAKKLNATGVHLTSSQFDEIQKAKDLGLFTIISCHNKEDLENALEKRVDAITYSPIFETPNKGEPKGIEALEEAINRYPNLNIIALGGIINDKQIEEISKTNAYGFASIRYFV